MLKIVALLSIFLLFNSLFSLAPPGEQQPAIERQLLEQTSLPVVNENAALLSDSKTTPMLRPPKQPERPCPTESVPQELVPIVKEACRRRSETSGNLFVTTTQGNETGLANWKVAMDRLNIHEWLVIAMHKEASQELTQWNISHVLFNGTGEPKEVLKERNQRYRKYWKQWHSGMELAKMLFLKRLWNERVHMVSALLQSGTTVTHCDFDAVLSQDPRPYVDTLLKEYDIIASQDKWPFSDDSMVGTSIQMGFVTLKASKRIQTFFKRRVLPAVDKLADDQHGINEALLQDGVHEHAKHVPWSGQEMTVETGSGLKVFFVPAEIYARRCWEMGSSVLKNATMLHCDKFFEASGIPKHVAKKYGYWFLDEEQEKTLSVASK